jgi:hypothetical protein
MLLHWLDDLTGLPPADYRVWHRRAAGLSEPFLMVDRSIGWF